MRLPPYADVLGIISERNEAGGVRLVMPFGPHLLGRPGFLHGGAIAGLLEMAAIAKLFEVMGDGDRPRIKPINVTVDFMRGGREMQTYAEGQVTRVGSRIANVSAEAWQDDRSKLIATARMNLMLGRAGCNPGA
jgi:uncharacterized protein (TIGR00369 family)